MFYNEICNIVILITLVILVMNVQILQSIPQINQYPKRVNDRTQEVNQQNSNYADRMQYFNKLTKNKRFSVRNGFKEEYKGKTDKISNNNDLLLDSGKVSDRNERSFINWLFQKDESKDSKEEKLFHKIKNISSYLENSNNIDLNDEPMNKNWNYYEIDQQDDKANYFDVDWYDDDYYEDLKNSNYLASVPYKTRREALPRQSENASLYPSVLTKAVEISMNPSVCPKSGGNLLANVAQKMNTNILDLANKLAVSSGSADTTGNLADTVQRLIKPNVLPSVNQPPGSPNQPAYETLKNSLNTLQVNPRNTNEKQDTEGKKENNEYIEENVTNLGLETILERILNKLDNMHDLYDTRDGQHPEGAPCDVFGTWSSSISGLCFEFQSNPDRNRENIAAEINNKILVINVEECKPAKQHHLMDLQWKFRGSAMKQLGGPLYMYGQKRSENVAATFLGFCRTCGGIDTIFGSWNFVSPSRDCNDISLAFDVKRDVLKRSLIEVKRKERFKNILYQSRLGKS